ncbi:MAG: prepilin-type N-terminal cleavage/methylation domain-containing protein [Candidatus Pacebacteria bacterium]|nr:prepilin-type N-terminal cleavage/methylation domain-containing protein [Candidatus Paceibacterota bacterium]
MNTKRGFTLLEILLVVAAITILAGIVILAINPNKQLADTRNSQRWMDVNAILNGVYQYSIDNNGQLPSSITASSAGICKKGVVAATCTTDSLVDLSVLTNSEKYLVSIPVDPKGSSTNSTNYEISLTAGGRIIVSAPEAEEGATISVQR